MKDVIREIGSHLDALPREKGISLPLISIRKDQIIVTRLIFFTRVTKERTYITPPQYVAEYNLTAGKFISMKKWDNQIPEPQNVEWKHERPTFKSTEDILAEFDEIWSLYDLLLPAFVKGKVSTETRHQAKKYLEYFNRHVEKPLASYYEYFGGDFLRFVKSAAS